MLRRSGGALSGLMAWVILWALVNFVGRNVWPAYAAAFPSRSFTLEMLLSRLGVGIFVTLTSGIVAAWTAKGDRQAALWFGLLFLIVGVADHIYIWDKYPVWYHLTFFAGIIPLSVLGGNLLKVETSE